MFYQVALSTRALVVHGLAGVLMLAGCACLLEHGKQHYKVTHANRNAADTMLAIDHKIQNQLNDLERHWWPGSQHPAIAGLWTTN